MTLITYIQGEERRLVGIATAKSGTVTIQPTPTITIRPTAGGADIVTNAPCTGYDPGAALEVEAWYLLDTSGMDPGWYWVAIKINVIDQDGKHSIIFAKGRISIQALFCD